MPYVFFKTKMFHFLKLLFFLSLESEKKSGKTVKDRLDDALDEKLNEVERKREKLILLDKKIAKLGDGQERRKLMYQKQQTDAYNRKHKKTPIDEERALHESYQIILKVSEVKSIVYKYFSRPKQFLVSTNPSRLFTQTIQRHAISGKGMYVDIGSV